MFDARKINNEDKKTIIKNFRAIYNAIENIRDLDVVKKDEGVDDLLFTLANDVFRTENQIYPLKALEEFDEEESVETFLNYVKKLSDKNDIRRSSEQFDNLELYFSNVEIPKKDEHMLAVLLNELEKTSILENKESVKVKVKMKTINARPNNTNVISFNFKR